MKRKMLLIDKNMNCVEIEISELNFRLLNVDYSKIQKHEMKRELNATITKFLNAEMNEHEMQNQSKQSLFK